MEPPYRLGLVATSRSGSTYFRRYLCDKYGLHDSASWLKHNPYEKINEAPFAKKHHILKILTHYVPDDEIDEVISESETVWLYRKNTFKQFLSHVYRLITKINLVYKKEEIEFLKNSIPNNSIVATTEQYDTFMRRLEKFWDLFYSRNKGTLVEYEKFVSDPKEVGWEIMEDYNLEWITWESMEPESHGWPDIKIPLKMSIDYENKFKNIEEIRKWFNG